MFPESQEILMKVVSMLFILVFAASPRKPSVCVLRPRMLRLKPWEFLQRKSFTWSTPLAQDPTVKRHQASSLSSTHALPPRMRDGRGASVHCPAGEVPRFLYPSCIPASVTLRPGRTDGRSPSDRSTGCGSEALLGSLGVWAIS